MSKQQNLLTELEEHQGKVPKLKADFIEEVLRRKHAQDYFQVQVKTGPTQSAKPGELQIIDALAIKRSWSNPCFTAYEVKVSRSDFQRDIKWGNYLNYCHQFYWACPSGLIRPDEVEDGCGLIWVNADGGWSVRKAARYRRINIPDDMLMYIIMSKLEPDRHPFFSTAREFFEAYVQDRHNGYDLKHRVSAKWRADLEAVEKKVAAAERKLAEVEGVMKAADILKKYGIDIRASSFSIDWELRRLEELLAGSMPQGALRQLQMAEAALSRAIAMVTPKESDEDRESA